MEIKLDNSVFRKQDKKLTNWKAEPTLEDLKNDLDEAKSLQDDIEKKINKRNKLRNGGSPIKPKKPGDSTVRPLVIRKTDEWTYPELEEPFLSSRDIFNLKPRTAEDVETARINGAVLNYQWDVQLDKVKFIGDVVRADVDDGTVIVKVGWEVEYGTKLVEKEVPVFASPEESMQILQQKVATGEIDQVRAQAMLEMNEPIQTGTKKVYVEEEVLVKNQPKYEVCDARYVTIDPTCDGNVKDAMFIIHKFKTSMAELKKNEYRKEKVVRKVPQADGTLIDVETEETTGYYKNLKQINIKGSDEYEDYKSEKVDFTFADDTRQKIEAYDYWGYWDIHGDGTVVPIVATWVGDVLIRLEENPYPFKTLPFATAAFMPKKGEVHGEANADLIADNQFIIGNLTRSALNIINAKSANQRFIHKSVVSDAISESNLKNGLDVIYNGNIAPKDAIHVSNIEAPSPVLHNLVQVQQQEIESLTGRRAFNNGIGGEALGTTAAGVRATMDSSGKRTLSVLRRINQMLVEVARMTIAMNQAYLRDEEVVRLTNGKHLQVRRDDLAGTFDIEVNVSTAQSDDARAQELSFMLQTMGNTASPQTTATILAKIARLRKMPDLAEAIEKDAERASQPDPHQEKAKELELEKMELENYKLRKDIEEADSRIIERISRSEENQLDEQMKAAKARKEEASASKIESERDNIDRKFVEESTGIDSEKRMIEKQHDKDIDSILQENEQLKQMLLEMRNRVNGGNTNDATTK